MSNPPLASGTLVLLFLLTFGGGVSIELELSQLEGS